MVTSLYIHVPFCRRKCDYCHFYVVPDRESFQDKYMSALLREWELRKPLFEERELYTLYLGGGTPSLLGPQRIRDVLSWLPKGAVEVTLEANPEDVTFEKMQAFRKAGINRISLGVQSFDDDLLRSLGRLHGATKAIEAVQAIAAAGIENLSIDLMYDLPGQTAGSWRATLKQAVALPINHLSLYNLTIEPHTVFYKKRKQLAPSLPTETASTAMLQEAIDILEGAGLSRYEISAFGRKALHNTGYWTGRPFIGMGPSAFSYWEGRRFQNQPHLHKWADALARAETPISFEERLDPAAQQRELLVIGLRLLSGVDLTQFSLDAQALENLKLLQAEGLVEYTPLHAHLTPKGLLFYDTVASYLI